MAKAKTAPHFRALTDGIAALQANLLKIGYADDDMRILIPAALGEKIEAELANADPSIWTPLTPGIGIYADGHLKQFTLCESVTVGWKLGVFNEGKEEKHEQSRRTNRHRI